MTNLAKLASSASSNVGARYAHIETTRVYELLGDHGFREDRYHQARSRNPEREGYQKHVTILQRERDITHEGAFNLLMVNSHDGSSSLHLEAGYFRVLCANQLGHGDIGVKIRHTGDMLTKIERAIPAILHQMEEFKQLQAVLRDCTLNIEQEHELIRAALQLRDLAETRFNSSQFGNSRRREGERNAWTQFNTIQENMVRGGMQVQAETKHGLVGIRKLRTLTSADRLLGANRELTATVKQLIAA